MLTKCIDSISINRDSAQDIHRATESIRSSIKDVKFDIEASVLICALLDKAYDAAANMNSEKGFLSRSLECDCGFSASARDWAEQEWMHEGCPKCDSYNYENNMSDIEKSIMELCHQEYWPNVY